MKKILSIILLFCSFAAFAQPADRDTISVQYKNQGVNSKNFLFNFWGTGGLGIQAGTTAQRPTVPVGTYVIRYNTDSSKIEVGTSSVWTSISGVIGGSGIVTLNTLTGSSQSFATGTTGTDFNINSTGTTHTFNIPDASATARGFVSTTTQTFTGAKTFSSNSTFEGAINKFGKTGQVGYAGFARSSDGVVVGEVKISGNNMVLDALSSTMQFAVAGSVKFNINSGGAFFGNTTSPATAKIHIAGGNTGAGLAPIKINPGNLMTTPEDGALEYNGTHWYATIGTTRYQLDQQSGTGTSSETLVKPNDANYTITTGTGNLAIVYFNTLTAERTVTLPDPATNTGRIFSIKHGGDGAFNLNLSVPIYENPSTWIVSVAPGAWINFMSDGTQFIKIR